MGGRDDEESDLGDDEPESPESDVGVEGGDGSLISKTGAKLLERVKKGVLTMYDGLFSRPKCSSSVDGTRSFLYATSVGCSENNPPKATTLTMKS